jgi:hypothetical protein
MHFGGKRSNLERREKSRQSCKEPRKSSTEVSAEAHHVGTDAICEEKTRKTKRADVVKIVPTPKVTRRARKRSTEACDDV